MLQIGRAGAMSGRGGSAEGTGSGTRHDSLVPEREVFSHHQGFRPLPFVQIKHGIEYMISGSGQGVSLFSIAHLE